MGWLIKDFIWNLIILLMKVLVNFKKMPISKRNLMIGRLLSNISFLKGSVVSIWNDSWTKRLIYFCRKMSIWSNLTRNKSTFTWWLEGNFFNNTKWMVKLFIKELFSLGNLLGLVLLCWITWTILNIMQFHNLL